MKIDLLDAQPGEVRIEVLPLIDVIFCVLTFFILAAVGLTRQQAINLDLPTANTSNPLTGQADPSQATDRLYVSVDAIGQVYLDQQPVSLDLLYDVLLQHQQLSPNGQIVLYASRDARYEDVMQILDLLRSVGGNRVALAVLPSNVGDLQQPTQTPSVDDLLTDPNALPPLEGAPPGSDPFAPTSPTFPTSPTSPTTPTDPLLDGSPSQSSPTTPPNDAGE